MKGKRGFNIFDSKAGSITTGVLIAAASLILCALISALLLSFTNMPTRHTKLCAMVAMTVSGAIASIMLAAIHKNGTRMHALLSLGIFAAIVLLVALIMSGGKIGGRIFMNCGCYMLVSSLCLFLGGRKTKRRRRRA